MIRPRLIISTVSAFALLSACGVDGRLSWTTSRLSPSLEELSGLQPDGSTYVQVNSATTYTVPSNTSRVEVWVFGGGGGGGGGGTSNVGGTGGPGGYVRAEFPVSPTDTLEVSIGTGGAGGGPGGCNAADGAVGGQTEVASPSIAAPTWWAIGGGGQSVNTKVWSCGNGSSGTAGVVNTSGGTVTESGGSTRAWGQGGSGGGMSGAGMGFPGGAGYDGHIVIRYIP